MKTYYAFFDPDCPLCQRLKVWLVAQPQRHPLRLIPRNDPEVERRFPDIGKWLQTDDLVVASSAGEIWVGPPAWLTILYTLEDHWEWSFRLAAPELQHLAFRAINHLSNSRAAVSKWFGPTDLDAPYGGEACASGCQIDAAE